MYAERRSVYQQWAVTVALQRLHGAILSNFFSGHGALQTENSGALLVKRAPEKFLSNKIPFQLLFSREIVKMEIFSALRSSIKGSKNSDLNQGLLSPRFSRWRSSKRQRSRNLTICRENKTSNSLPASRSSSVFGDSCLDLPKINGNQFKPEDYLDPFQGKERALFTNSCWSILKFFETQGH